jgi:hypothetical protein
MRILAVIVLAAGCGDVVTPTPLPDDYTTWSRIDTYGEVPGHGDTYRVIYVNDAARAPDGLRNDLDAVLVKEVRDNLDGEPGDLQYLAIMRKVRAGYSREDEGGWLFTQTDAPGGEEVHLDLCWNRCHVQAPFAGVWLDYSQLP